MTRKPKYDYCVDCNQHGHIQGHNRCKRCYQKWYCAKPEVKARRAELARKYRKENPEKHRALDKVRRQTKKRRRWQDRYNREYYLRNAEKRKRDASEWRKANPQRRDDYKRAYRSRKKGLLATLTSEEWERILQQHQHRCCYCKRNDVTLVKEHWIPASRGGNYTAENILPACPHCNSRKGTKTGNEFLALLKKEKEAV